MLNKQQIIKAENRINQAFENFKKVNANKKMQLKYSLFLVMESNKKEVIRALKYALNSNINKKYKEMLKKMYVYCYVPKMFLIKEV